MAENKVETFWISERKICLGVVMNLLYVCVGKKMTIGCVG